MNTVPTPPSNVVPFVDRRQRQDGPPRGQAERRATASGRRATDALKMPCPFCGCSESAVCRSRGSIEVEQIRRRRECVECGKRFPTYERVDQAQLEREAHGDAALSRELMRSAAPLPRATWPNVDQLVQKLWAESMEGRYSKGEWGALQALLAQIRDITPPPASAVRAA